MASTRANIKLAISGGQNEPRDAIAGSAWALLTHPNQLAMIQSGEATWLQAFEEYARWISPIGMTPRRVAKNDTDCGVTFNLDERVFFMFGSGNRDEDHFENPDQYDITRNTRPAHFIRCRTTLLRRSRRQPRPDCRGRASKTILPPKMPAPRGRYHLHRLGISWANKNAS